MYFGAIAFTFWFRLECFAVYASSPLLPPETQDSLRSGLAKPFLRRDFHPQDQYSFAQRTVHHITTTESMHSILLAIAEQPLMGHECPEIAEGLRRHDHLKHAMVFPLTFHFDISFIPPPSGANGFFALSKSLAEQGHQT
ncbi:plasmid stabilization protein [Xenorhabdus vietnamensis]|uniref:Plasmid stabilization protein n=1 Tax=Xenorhabdus vietnamensis TaxID=351656 RepID=A0A1Y2S674_9GAMM|nr:plasmid stabilization protein [Xenorhabdus vietnamensis]